jgi:thioredoxin 1
LDFAGNDFPFTRDGGPLPSPLAAYSGGYLSQAHRRTDQTHFPKAPRQRNAMSENISKVTDDSFDQDVLKSQTPVLVDYWAEWCGPCKMIAPVLDEIAKDYQGKLKIAKLNIDENPATPPKYGIRGIPTLMLFKGGEVEATKVGAVSKAQLAQFLDSHL